MSTDFTGLLDEFRQVPVRTQASPTILEIAGYPHYENVCSNILAFFLDPGNPHGLGMLFFDALARIGGIDGHESGFGGNISVEREVFTHSRNKLDILIKSDTQAILIENKLFAALDNPFEDYAKYLESLGPPSRKKRKFTLTLEPTTVGAAQGFKNIRYAQFLSAIRSLLGHYTAGADIRYLTFMLDFLRTLENLQAGTAMDQTFVNLLRQRRGEVEAFLGDIKKFKDEMRDKVERLGALIDVSSFSNVRQWFYRESWILSDTLVHDIQVSSDLLVAIDTIIRPQGWEIHIFQRRGGDRLKLKHLLENLKIQFEEGERFILPAKFEYTEQLESIQPEVQKLVTAVASSSIPQESSDNVSGEPAAAP